MSEPDIDGDAATFFFFEAIGVDPGERLDQRGFAMIDVTGCADDDRFHREQYRSYADCERIPARDRLGGCQSGPPSASRSIRLGQHWWQSRDSRMASRSCFGDVLNCCRRTDPFP